ARAALPVAEHRVGGAGRRENQGLLRGTLSRPRHRLPDFTGHGDVQSRKQEFFAWMLPLVEVENARLRDVRWRLTAAFELVRWGRPLSREDAQWLQELALEFRIQDADPRSGAFWRTAFERVDALPVDLVVVQAANESAWGTSRFAREGNNLFGQWCFRPGCGIVPLDRPEGASYEVARFGSPAESVASYMRNLNTGRSYQLLRELRARRRAQGQPPGAQELAAGLVDYSERGPEYVDEIRAMIRVNGPVIAAARGLLGAPRGEEG
ncbi:MAG: glucosaminidase domain-containing protein, partial [Krumholzibacteria bacterium]|nr:glucosaminidase domain-containing protein [Candidatus Krumholzibacteria bacterium]